jgi:hypothetical protein
VARLKPSTDLYVMAAYRFSVEPMGGSNCSVVFEFLSQGYGVETYLRLGWMERVRDKYDWSHYDTILDEVERHGPQWFPMLLAGSGYGLPARLYESTNNVGVKCLEHGLLPDTERIFHPFQADYASNSIAEFGNYYGRRKSLLVIRLGPSGD